MSVAASIAGLSPDRSSFDWTHIRPPQLLLGCTLLVWGLFAELTALGILLALLIEGSRWFKWRWNFSDGDFVRIWNLCVAIFLTFVVFQFVERNIIGGNFTQLIQKWLPVILAPMILAQCYSQAPGVSLVTFSLVARRKRLIDERAGRRLKPVRRFHLGYFYFAVLLLSIGSVSPHDDKTKTFLIVASLLAWSLYGFIPRDRRIAAACLIPLACCLAYGLQFGLRRAQLYLHARAEQWLYGDNATEAHRARTQIGEIGLLKLSMDIDWRVKNQEGTPPNLLREAAYHAYLRGVWKNRRHAGEMPLLRLGEREEWEVFNLPFKKSRNALRIRGRLPTHNAVIPAPFDTGLFVDLPADYIYRNDLGTFIARRLGHQVVDYLAVRGEIPGTYLEPKVGPDPDYDLDIAPQDTKDVKQAAKQLGVTPAAPSRERIDAVRRFFGANGFRYSRYQRHDDVKPLSDFLFESRQGHCEYYATATTLLLRQLGVPARYVVGYAVREYDETHEEYLLRGMHRHAWVEAWNADEKRWETVDTTPPSWLDAESRPLTAWQRFQDAWNHWMMQWHVWRRAEDKGLIWTFLPLLLAGALLIIVVIRLLRGLQRQKGTEKQTSPDRDPTILLGLDSRWFAVETALKVRGEHRGAHQTVLQWCHELTSKRPEWRQNLTRAARLHCQYRFDPAGLTEAEKSELADTAGALLEILENEQAKAST